MKRSYLFLCLSFFLTSHLAAQTATLSLARESLGSYELPVSVDSVIDQRDQPELAGKVYKGIFNTPKAALFETPVAREFQRMLNEATVQQKAPVVWLRVNRLAIYELRSATAEYGVSELDLSFITPSSGEEIFRARVSENYRAMDVTGRFDASITALLIKAMEDYRLRRERGLLANYQADLPTNDSTYPPGVYYSLYDLRERTPDTTLNFEYKVKTTRKVSKLRISWNRKNLPAKQPLAVSVAEGLFYLDESHGIKLIPSDHRLYLEERPKSAVFLKDNRVFYTLAFGLIGTMVYEAALKPRDRLIYFLDLQRGNISTQAFQESWKPRTELLVYASSFNENDELVAVSLNGVELCRLAPGGYLYRSIGFDGRGPNQLCLQLGDEKECLALDLELYSLRSVVVTVERRGRLDIRHFEGYSVQLESDLKADLSHEACPESTPLKAGLKD